jgi:hypothetical protein
MAGFRTTGKSFEHETLFSGARSDRWGRMRVASAPGTDAEQSILVAVVEDTTERREWELAVAASETHFRTLFELAPVAIQREDYSAAMARAAELALDPEALRRHLERHPEDLETRLALVEVVDESIRTLPGMAIEVDAPDGPVPAVADPARVRQIVRNLGTNALRYGGPRIRVAVRRLDGRCRRRWPGAGCR